MALSEEPNRRPSLQPTRPATLAVAGLTTTALAWIMISNLWGSMPRLPFLPPLTLIGLAIVEGVYAYSTKNRIDRRSGAGPIEPLVIARLVVLAKASAMAGALFAGLYLGMTTWLVIQRDVLARVEDDIPQSVLGLVGSVGLMLAALALERACRVPPGKDERGEPPLADDRTGREPEQRS